MTGQPDATRDAWWAEQDRVIKAWRAIMSSDVLIGEGNDADRPEVWIEAWTGYWDALADRLAEADQLRAERDAAVEQVKRVRALRDEWGREPDTDGECPDGLCGACTLGNASELLTSALDGPPTDRSEASDRG